MFLADLGQQSTCKRHVQHGSLSIVRAGQYLFMFSRLDEAPKEILCVGEIQKALGMVDRMQEIKSSPGTSVMQIDLNERMFGEIPCK